MCTKIFGEIFWYLSDYAYRRYNVRLFVCVWQVNCYRLLSNYVQTILKAGRRMFSPPPSIVHYSNWILVWSFMVHINNYVFLDGPHWFLCNKCLHCIHWNALRVMLRINTFSVAKFIVSVLFIILKILVFSQLIPNNSILLFKTFT